jgi:hypothetical protein
MFSLSKTNIYSAHQRLQFARVSFTLLKKMDGPITGTRKGVSFRLTNFNQVYLGAYLIKLQNICSRMTLFVFSKPSVDFSRANVFLSLSKIGWVFSSSLVAFQALNLVTDLQHHLWLLMLKEKLYLAPVNIPQRVLDVGTGTGIWAIEFGRNQVSSS